MITFVQRKEAKSPPSQKELSAKSLPFANFTCVSDPCEHTCEAVNMEEVIEDVFNLAILNLSSVHSIVPVGIR